MNTSKVKKANPKSYSFINPNLALISSSQRKLFKFKIAILKVFTLYNVHPQAETSSLRRRREMTK